LPSASTTFRLHLAVSIATSLLSHTALLACMALLGGQGRVVWVSVQSGVASINLMATMAASPSKGEENERKPDPTLLEPTPADRHERKPPVLLALADVAVTPVTRDASQPAMPRAEPPHEVPETLVRPRVTTALEQPVLHAQNAPSAERDASLRSMPHVPRADVGRRLASSLVPSTASSVPSPGSVASRGAQSDLPAIVYNPAPDYPADALAARQIGRVLLRVAIAADGAVTEAAVHQSSGVASLDVAAVATVRQWRFAAAESGVARRELIVPVRFRIEDAL
jgi:protein TonB